MLLSQLVHFLSCLTPLALVCGGHAIIITCCQEHCSLAASARCSCTQTATQAYSQAFMASALRHALLAGAAGSTDLWWLPGPCHQGVVRLQVIAGAGADTHQRIKRKRAEGSREYDTRGSQRRRESQPPAQPYVRSAQVPSMIDAPLRRRSRPQTARSEAVKQLLRIELGGAFSALVSGDIQPTTTTPAAAPGVADGAAVDDLEDEEHDVEQPGLAELFSSALTSPTVARPVATDAAAATAATEVAAAAARSAADGPGGGGASGSRVQGLGPEQQREVKALVAGVTRMRRRLDFIISRLSDRNVDSLDPPMRQVGGTPKDTKVLLACAHVLPSRGQLQGWRIACLN